MAGCIKIMYQKCGDTLETRYSIEFEGKCIMYHYHISSFNRPVFFLNNFSYDT
jgi:hypothetical protein